ncbi:MAG: DEAD/DEAH box helicase [Chloroflexi bacterium]|nr:DEAD/DEAH box helicase [Chloroflexota bacterium]
MTPAQEPVVREPAAENPAPLRKRATSPLAHTRSEAPRTPAPSGGGLPYQGPERGKFGDIELSGAVAAALAEMGYVDPSPIQMEAVPGCIEGRDLVGQAITGSGKTAAFGIPICERIDPYDRNVQAIVLVPTRELAMQVTREVERIGKYRGVSVCAVYGGQPIQRQLQQLQRGANVVVGTPGRIMDHMGRGTLDLQHVKVAVLDEADEMLDIGFADDMEFILRRTPRTRQTLLFSATIPGFVRKLIRRYQDDPMWIQLGAEIQTVDEVDQIYFEVAERDKEAALRLVLNDVEKDARILVFRRTQIGVDRLARALKSQTLPVMGLHGGLSQGERNEAMGKFRSGELSILVSTNVAARGIDIPEISHVFNYDLPNNVEEYVHRIGRTARMGRRGYAVSFVAEWDFEGWEKIRSHLGDGRLVQGKLPFYD